MLSHLVAVVSAKTSPNQDQDTMLNEAIDILYHPGSDIILRGYFLRNTLGSIKAKLSYS